MDLRQVEYAVGVLDHGGFTRAAAALHVSQPSLSQGIANLEADLGTALFHRLRRQVRPTAAGEAFAAPARQLLRDVQTIRAAVVAVTGLHSGRLDLVTLPTLVAEPVAGIVGGFRRAHPGVTVRLFEPEDTEAVMAMVRDGTCEIGATELPAPADLDAVDYGTQELLAVCPPGTVVNRRRLKVASLAGLPLITTPPGTSTRRLVDDALAGAGIAATVAVETAHREAILPLVLAGAGTSFLPAPLAAEAATRGAVVTRLDPPLVRQIGFVHRCGPLSPAAAAFLALVPH